MPRPPQAKQNAKLGVKKIVVRKRPAFGDSQRARESNPEIHAGQPYRVLVETMRAGAAMINAEGNVVYANAAMSRLLNQPIDELIGVSFRDLVAFEDRLTFDGLMDRAADLACEGELTLVQEHRRLPTHLSLAPAQHQDDLLICLVATDLSPQKRSNEMAASERLARFIVEQVPEVVVVCDESGRIARVSDAIRTFTDQNLLLRPFAQAFPFPGVEAVVADATAGKHIEGLSLAIEDDRGTDRMRYLLANFSPLRDHEDRAIGCVVAMTDVTNLKLTESRLHEAVRARDDLLSIAAHELRTPLTSLQLQIDSLIQILRIENISSDKWDLGKKLGIAARQTERLSALTEALLDVARLTGGKMTFHDEDLDLRDLVQDVVERNRQAAQRAACVLRIEAPSEPVVGCWDRTRVEQVLVNLIGNALKYGGGKPVDIRVEDRGEDVRVRVRDRGIGVAPEDTERIFQCFERGVPSEQFGGLGLGLFIARQVVESYGGSISVDGNVGPGAAFLVALPKQRLAT